jgi:hypothetical protein
VGQER